MEHLLEYNQFNSINYSDILDNKDIVKNSDLIKKILLLSHSNLSGGIKAVWNYPIENPSDVVIAFDAKEPIGIITVGKNDKSQNIFVLPKYRKIGIASELKNIIYKRK